MKERAEKCARGHNDWKITDQTKGTRRCRACQRLKSGNRQSTLTPAFGVGANGKKMHSSRGGSGEDTWGRTELLKFRGYDV